MTADRAWPPAGRGRGKELLGKPVDRVDGPLKVTGTATYPSDVTFPGLAHATLVQSTIGAGTISRIDTENAQAAPGVLAVITHENVPSLAEGPMTSIGPSPRFPLKDNRVVHYGQHVAVVVAETPAQAAAAARLIKIDYEEMAPVLGIDNPQAPVTTNPNPFGGGQRGDAAAALAAAEVVYDETFTMAPETHNPLGLFATVARWEGDRLIVHDSNQWPMLARQTLAAVFSLPETNVRVLVPYLGGGFGAGLRIWSHTILAALAARIVDRPVKLVLTRPQMFTSIGHRTQSRQRLRLGATREGRLVAIDHEGTATIGAEEIGAEQISIEPISNVAPPAYNCRNVATHDRQVALNIPKPAPMRAPGSVQGNFALESVMDELSYRLGLDPLELRLRNYAEVDPRSGLPWSSNGLRECYRVGAERFGWKDRNPGIGSVREGEWLVGYGMAGITFEWQAAPCQARISINRDGTAHVRSAAMDLGTGTYTVAAQLSAELLGLDIDDVRVELGDSDLSPAPPAGGSGQATSLVGAIDDAAGKLIGGFLDIVTEDVRSPLRGRRPSDVTASEGRLHLADDPTVGESYVDILARHELDEIAADGEKTPNPQADGMGMRPSGGFGAQFAEVRIHEELGIMRIARLVSAIDGGRILNAKTARSQIIGAVIMGIGMATLEESVFDSRSGRIVNATLGDYLIPTNADVPDLDVAFVGEPDRFNPVGVKGLGEIGIVGVPAAIANAVYHATGRRIRSLPITIDQLL